MIYKLCRKCKQPIPYGGAYCDKCRGQVEADFEKFKKRSTAKYNRNRDKGLKQFYNSKLWIMLRERKLQQSEYRCEECSSIATQIHHIVEVKDDWNKRFDYDNLMCLCVKCHNKIHKRF